MCMRSPEVPSVFIKYRLPITTRKMLSLSARGARVNLINSSMPEESYNHYGALKALAPTEPLLATPLRFI